MTSEEYGQYIDDFEMGIDVDPDETLTQYIERRRREFESKANGGSIGIEVLFGPKRDEFSIGGNVKKNQPYDPKASAVDYATALEKVGGGTAAQKSKSLSNYIQSLTPKSAPPALATAAQFAQGILGVDLGTPQTKSMTNFLQKTIQDKIAQSGKLSGSIDYRDYGVQTGPKGQHIYGKGDVSFNSPEFALATTLGKADYAVDPKTGKVTFTGGTAYDFPEQSLPFGLAPFISKGGFFGDKALDYSPDVALNSDFMKQYNPSNISQSGVLPGFTKLRNPNSSPGNYNEFMYKGPDGQIYGSQTYASMAASGSYKDIYKDYYSKQKKADGGRVRMVSGGALKGLMSLFKRGGDDAVDLVKQEEIFREGPITTKFLEDVDDKLIKKFVRTRDTKGPGSYGMYDSFDDMPAGLKAAEIIKRFVDKKTGKINYEDAEFFIGRKLKGDETIDELIDIAISKPIGMGKGPFKDFEEYVLGSQKKADGGRVGLFMGGPALTGEALSIYNSMSAYGFSDQEIANALAERGLYTPGGTTEETDIIASAPNIINQQTGGDGPSTPPGPTYSRDDDLGTSDYQGTGPGFLESIADYAKSGGIFGAGFRTAKDFFSKVFQPNVNTFYKGPTVDAIAKEKARQEKERAEFLAAQQRTNIASQLGGPDGQSGGKYAGGEAFASANPYGGSGTDDDMGADSFAFKEGGLATMFTRRR
jgi:hypothetical protein